MSYQDRKDIDALFDLVWDNNNNQTQFTTREEFEEFKNYIKSNYSMSAFIDALASNMDENGLVLFENIGDISLFDGESVSEALQNAQGDIGNVDSSADGTLQQQIANVINNLIFDNGIGCVVVNTIADRDALNPRLYRACYVKATGKFYAYTGEDILGG